MCGRVGFYDDAKWTESILANYGSYNNLVGNLNPSYNIAPSQPLAALLNNGDYTYTHFGLIPHWAKEKKVMSINARAETLSQKPSFREPFRQKRCIIPANGFYEWKQDGKHKMPFWIHPKDDGFFAFAGLWDQWLDNQTGEIITSTAIITTEPNELMKDIHDRMPVILKPDDWKLWLDRDVQESAAVMPLLTPYSSDLMEAFEVSTYVNSPVNDVERCIQQVKHFLF